MCAPRMVGGLGIINLKKVLVASLCKSIMYALEPKDFSFRTLFKYTLKHCFPQNTKGEHHTFNGLLSIALPQFMVPKFGIK